ILGVGGTIVCALAALGKTIARRWRSLDDTWQLWLFLSGLLCVGIASLFVALTPQPYHNLHGFLLASPFIALALWPPTTIFTNDGITPPGLLYAVTLLYIAAHALIISSLSGLGPVSRSEWGQRYLLSAYPLL